MAVFLVQISLQKSVSASNRHLFSPPSLVIMMKISKPYLDELFMLHLSVVYNSLQNGFNLPVPSLKASSQYQYSWLYTSERALMLVDLFQDQLE